MEDGEKKEKKSSLRKIDNRIRVLIENGVAKHHRSLFVVVGDRGRDQVVFFHHMLTKATIKAKPSVLWCYKKELGFSSHRKKRMKKLDKKIKAGRINVNTDDQFELFIAGTNIRYCYYKETHKILGNTFGMAVLQDFEALTPNLLARSIETVEGGGIIVILLPPKQLKTLTMDVHARYKTEAHQDVSARFNERFMRSLALCGSCMIVDDRLQVLSQNFSIDPVLPGSMDHKVDLSGIEGTNPLTQPLVRICKTIDQGSAVVKCVEAVADKTLRTTVAMTAGRGRGKSAALGLAIAAAVAYQYSNIFVTAPSPENLKTVFEFVFKGFDALGYREHLDYTIIQSREQEHNKAVVRVNITREHRQTIQYIHPGDSVKLSQAELVVVDEAAAIPLPLVKKLMGPYLVFLSSTVSGYEGTGRSLSLKLIQQLRQQSAPMGTTVSRERKPHPDITAGLSAGRKLVEVTLEESIRYANKDPVERWLNGLLCLEASVPRLTAGCPAPQSCELFHVNRDTLFSYGRHPEMFLQRIVSLFVSSHYKNSPNDLQMLSDAPAHNIFVLLGPEGMGSTGLPDVLCVLQVCLEGEISKSSVESNLDRGRRAAGDLIPWTISQQFDDSGFASLAGARIVRIATHPDYQGMGYGSRALQLLVQYYEGKMASLSEGSEQITQGNEGLGEGGEKKRALCSKLTERRAEKLDYLGVSYGLTSELLKFWKKGGFTPVYLCQKPNDLTGEHSMIMLRLLNEEEEEGAEEISWLEEFWKQFRERYLELMPFESFKTFRPQLALSILDQKKFDHNSEGAALQLSSTKLSARNIRRLERYAQNMVDYHQILDLIPGLAQLYFANKVPVHLSAVQNVVLLALGLQCKSVDALTKELDLPATQVLALFNKTVRKMVTFLREVQAKEVESSLPSSEVTVDMRPTKQTLEEDLNEAAASLTSSLKQYAIKGSDKDWTQALGGGLPDKSMVSIKGVLGKRRKEAAEEDMESQRPKEKKKFKKKKHDKFFAS